MKLPNFDRDMRIFELAATGLTIDDLCAVFDMGHSQVSQALHGARMYKLGYAEAALLAQPLAASAQKRLAAHQRKLNKDFAWEVRQAAAAQAEAHRANIEKHWQQKLGKLEAAWTRRGRVFSKLEYNNLIRALHPDTGKNVSDEKRAEMFRIVNDRKIKLLDENDFAVVAELPKTVSDLVAAREARRRQVQAERSRQSRRI